MSSCGVVDGAHEKTTMKTTTNRRAAVCDAAGRAVARHGAARARRLGARHWRLQLPGVRPGCPISGAGASRTNRGFGTRALLALVRSGHCRRCDCGCPRDGSGSPFAVREPSRAPLAAAAARPGGRVRARQLRRGGLRALGAAHAPPSALAPNAPVPGAGGRAGRGRGARGVLGGDGAARVEPAVRRRDGKRASERAASASEQDRAVACRPCATFLAPSGVYVSRVYVSHTLRLLRVQLTTTAKRERMADALASCRLDLSAGEMASLEAAADASPPLRAYWTGAAVDWE